MRHWLAISVLLFAACAIAQQNPDLKVNMNDYSLGLGQGSYTCFDGTSGTGNYCLGKWLASSIFVINGGSSSNPTNGLDCTTAYPGSWCAMYYSSVPYLSNMYNIRDAVGASKYERAILHNTIDIGALHASSIIGMDQFDWFDQINGLTEGFNYYVPSNAQNGVLLYNGATFVSDITGLAYGGAVVTVAYNAGTFTLTGISSQNFTNISAGSAITLTGFTAATFLNGKTALVSTVSGTGTPVMTLLLSCSSNCTGTNETGYVASPQAIPAGDSLYLAFMEPFDVINVRLATSQVGGSVTYEYSKGAGVWGNLTTASHWSDGTAGLTSGLSQVRIGFYPPSDWATDSVHGSRQKFWVRITPTGASTQPAIFNLRGDNLLSTYVSTGQCGSVVQPQTGNSCLLRGWSASAYAASTACSGSPCVVAGSYLYNPSPPTSASARFLYQGRTGGYGGYPNEVWLNPGAIDTGSTTLAGEILPYMFAAVRSAYGVTSNATMFDNGASTVPMNNWNGGNNTDLPCAPSCTDTLATSNFESYWETAFAQTTANLHASYTPFFVTGNVSATHPTSSELTSSTFPTTAGTLGRVCPGLDFCWIEASSFATSAGYFNSFPQTAENQFTVAQGQPFQVSNAVSDHTFPFGFCDVVSQSVPCLPILWNRATRGSMVALLQQYMFGNSNAGLTYTITSESSYTAGDQFYYFADSGSTLTAPIGSGLQASGFTFQVSSTTPLVAGVNNMGGAGTGHCVGAGCGTDNLFVGNTIIRLCPASTTCENGDIFQVTTSAPTTVTPNTNVTQTACPGGGSCVGVVNNYAGTEKVQILQYGHAALTLTASMPAWQAMDVYATIAPAFRVDIGVPDSSSNAWQPPAGNCIYNPNYVTLTQPTTVCNHGDPDLFYGSTTLLGSAQIWSGLACVAGKYSSAYGTSNMDCAPLERRDYTKAIVLLRPGRTGGTLPTAPDEWATPSQPINLSSFQPSCAPSCQYTKLLPDGTQGPAISSITLTAGNGAILMKQSSSLPASAMIIQGAQILGAKIQ